MLAHTTDNPQLPRCSANFATEIKLHNIYQLYLGNQPSHQSLTNLLSCLFVSCLFVSCLFVWSFIFSIVPPSGDQLSGLVLFHLKGITASLDPLLYKWICYKSPAPKVTPRHKAERERTKTTRQQSLPKTPSATTPRKKSFARGRCMKRVSCYLMWNVLRTSLCKNQTTGKWKFATPP